jgi:hypothetical protein
LRPAPERNLELLPESYTSQPSGSSPVDPVATKNSERGICSPDGKKTHTRRYLVSFDCSASIIPPANFSIGMPEARQFERVD